MSATIRPFEIGDADGLAALVLGIQQREFGIAITYEDQPDLRDVAGYFREARGGFWVAVDGPEVVGCVGLVDLGNGQGALRKMFVRPDHRGSDKSVAQRLLAALLGHARAAGIRRLYLGTTEKFRAAHRFYEKSGFARVAETELPANFSRMALDTRFYTIELSTDTRPQASRNAPGAAPYRASPQG
ncbi:MAG TPA: GNAT family N-acetyltransferase [Stellaceae bacterium]|nr:GNAT family N-acetyltransferase [Stellaceae bacterium]